MAVFVPRSRARTRGAAVRVRERLRVLESAYGKSRAEVLDAIDDLRCMPVLAFERDAVVGRLLSDGRTVRADLADLLIAYSALANGCDTGITFDKEAARLPFFRLLPT
jgi:predicted nucleic-acid-binding protein